MCERELGRGKEGMRQYQSGCVGSRRREIRVRRPQVKGNSRLSCKAGTSSWARWESKGHPKHRKSRLGFMPGGWIVKKRSCPSVIGDNRGKSGFSTARKTGVRISWLKAKNRGGKESKREEVAENRTEVGQLGKERTISSGISGRE